jgi:hypothetical protein
MTDTTTGPAGGAPAAPLVTASRPLGPDTVLQRIPDVHLALTAAGTVRITSPTGAVVECGHVALRIVERFGRPATLRDVAAERAAGAQEWVDLLETARTLVSHGVLVDPREREARSTSAAQGYWWDNPRPHIEMLDDRQRTRRYIEAIERTVRPGDTVVDIGTGTGVLALAAARAGAARVYAIEAGAIAGKAEEIIAANGFADTVRVVRGWSTSIELPQRGDVLVTETLGSDPFNERILEIVIDARKRLVTPDARIVPRRISLFGVAVEVPESSFADWVYTTESCERWRTDYGFDFGPLVAHERWVQGVRVPMTTTRTWRRLTPPATLMEVDLRSTHSGTLAAVECVPVLEAGQLDGAFLYFDAELASGVALSTDPDEAREDRHWWNVLSLHPPTGVDPGQLVQLSYGRNSSTVERGLTISLKR